MSFMQNVVVILLSCVALGVGSAWLVDSAARIAYRLGISQLVIGLTVVAFGTSAPEFAVTIAGALTGKPDVSVGNIIGSNIFNIGFILGGCALVTAVKTRAALVWRDGIFLLLITGLLLFFLVDHELVRREGMILFGLLIVYLFFLFKKKEQIIEDSPPLKKSSWKDGPFFLLGMALIIGGGYFLVEAAVNVAESLGMSQWVIGVTIVAAGTSVPEFVISLVALLKKHHGISAGNLIGSNLFNTLGVLGLAGALHPLTVASSALFSMGALIGITLIVIVFMRTGWRLNRGEGFALVLISLAVWIYNIVMIKPQ